MPGLIAVGTGCAVCTVIAACTGLSPKPGAGTAPEPTQVSTPATVDAGVELPPGPGRDLLASACLDCHDLGGLTLFSSFYTRDDWRTLVLTMIETGASIAPVEVEAIADYLGQHFGADSP